MENTLENDCSSNMTSPLDLSFNNASSSPEMNRVESSILTGAIQNDVSNQITIKQEPHDVDQDFVQESMIKCE